MKYLIYTILLALSIVALPTVYYEAWQYGPVSITYRTCVMATLWIYAVCAAIGVCITLSLFVGETQ